MGLKKLLRDTLEDFLRWLSSDNSPDKAAYDNSVPISSRGMTKSASGVSGSNSLDDGTGLNFTVFSATGGKIVKVHSYDKRLDRVNSSLHIITEHEDLGEELAQIITRENLTR